ncbi:MAG: GNAT family N-acetyltransferase [Anaerolineae bacterium]|nr:GNAT family N-acetyltransferase [Anaerolineae bacterium]
MSAPHDTLNLPRPLGDGLVLRLAAPEDTEAVAEFNSRIHLMDGEPMSFLPAWTRVLMLGQHPTMLAQDFVLVEDTQAHKIVSATCLIPQIWHYHGIPFKMGQPELVGTDPAYRRRGLARHVFEAIHTLSDAYGHQVQGITGIPWFYRQFGYEYALNLGGGRNLPVSRVPELKEDETEPYRVRPATEADIPTLIRLYQRCAVDKLVTVPMDETRWLYELRHRHFMGRVNCLTNADNDVVGTYSYSAELWGSRVETWALAVAEGISLRTVLPTVARALKAHGEARLAALNENNKDGPKREFTTIRFGLGADHPAYEAFDAQLDKLQNPYGWYIRVPDVPGFMRHIAPALEKRLADSVMSGYSGELKITFYRGGLRLVFEQGRLAVAEAWRQPADEKERAGAGFPPLVFLKLLFGYRSLAELRNAYPDCWAEEEPALLLNALFPRQASWVMQMV